MSQPAASAAIIAPVVAPSARAAAAGPHAEDRHHHHGSLIQLDVSADDDRLNSGFESSTGRLKMGASASTNYYCRPGASQSTATGQSATSLRALTVPPPAPTAACIGRAPPSPRSRGAAEDVSFLLNWLAEQHGDSYDVDAPMLLPPPMSEVLRTAAAAKAGPPTTKTETPVLAKAGNPFR